MSDVKLKVLREVLETASREGYKGHDPYDCLNSPLLSRLPGRYLKIAATQTLLYSPMNLRPLLGIDRERNPKGLALFLLAHLNLRDKGMDSDIEADPEIEALFGHLVESANRGHSGISWGYHFPWQDLAKFIPRGEPSVVVTGYVANALHRLHAIRHDDETIGMLEGIGRFISKDLNRYTDQDGTCLSYSPHDHNIVHNANLLGAVALQRVMKATGDDRYMDLVEDCFSFTLKKQHVDGSWAYSQDSGGRERNQIDFHQGFVLEAIMDHISLGGSADLAYPALKKGLAFYARQFREDGASFWRYPRRWPIDIHHQAQGIITFNKASDLDARWKGMSSRISSWTLKNMYLGGGRFAYQIWPLVKNKISYVRWGNAWTAYAISSIVGKEDGNVGSVQGPDGMVD